MFRKACFVMFMLSLICMFSVPSFAEDTSFEEANYTDREVAQAIEILAPEMNAEGNVSIEKDNLYINIRLNLPVEVYFNLYKVDSQGFAETEKTVSAKVAETNVVENVVFLDPETDEEDGEVIPEILSENDKATFRKRIIELYKEANQKIEALQIEIESHLSVMEEAFGELPLDSEEALLNEEQIQLLRDYELLKEALEEHEENLEDIEFKYKQLFEKLVFGPELIEVSDVIPQYINEIEDINPGQYKMVFFRDSEEQKAIKVMYFTIETSEETIEKIVETIPQDLDRIWEVNPEQSDSNN